MVEVNGLLIDRISETTEAGMVGVNTGLISIEIASFNGVRQPGRDGALHWLDDYLKIKYLGLDF